MWVQVPVRFKLNDR